MKHSRVMVFILLAIFYTGDLVAQKMPVSPLVQAALLKKIFKFDKALSAKETVTVTVIGGGDEILSALKSVGINATSGTGVGGDVVYVGSDPTTKAATAKAGVLSVSGIPSNAEKGFVSIGFGVEEGGKPKIVINMTQLKAEGHELSADLLVLARIIQ